MMGLLDFCLVNFRQTIDIVVVALDTEVLGKVNDLDILWDGVLLQEGFALSVPEAEEDDIDLVKWHFIGKLQVRFADKTFMYIAHQITRITL